MSSSASSTTTIAPGSLVLVTGATGSVASHVIRQFLERGYRVRGTVREPARAAWLSEGAFGPFAARGDLTLAVVPDMAAPGAFLEAVRGVAAVVHVASIVSFDPDPHNVVPLTVAGATGVLEAALQTPSVRAFVYTSSQVASTSVATTTTTTTTTSGDGGGTTARVGPDAWNEEAVQQAWAPGPYDAPGRGAVAYAASKVAAEKAVWKFAAERKPHFVVNAVLPALIIGEPLARVHLEMAGAWLKQVWDGDFSGLSGLKSVWTVDVKDVALLHVAAVLAPNVNNARVFAWGRPTIWKELVPLMEKAAPAHDFVKDVPDVAPPSLTVDQDQALALLRWGGQEGWTPLVETVADNVKGIVDFIAEN